MTNFSLDETCGFICVFAASSSSDLLAKGLSRDPVLRGRELSRVEVVAYCLDEAAMKIDDPEDELSGNV